MELRHLKLVKAVSEEGSLTGAAEQLHLSQSALSHQLRKLEEELGASVFNRINKKLVLTQAGEKVLESARKILDELSKTRREIAQLMDGESGLIRLSTECYTSYHWLPPIIKAFNKRYPKVEIEIKTDSDTSTIKNLLEGELDVALVHEAVKDSNIRYTKLLDDELVTIFNADHPFSEKEVVLPSDFKEETLITHSKNFESSTLNQKVLKRYNITPANITYVQLTGAALEMVRADLGVTVMPYWMASNHLNHTALSYLPLTRQGLLRKWKIATLKDQHTPSYIRHFTQLLKEKQQQIYDRFEE
ncbi:LysR family transcriptional regulator [Fodinibius salsisoli]|uniref:LysR family transcriptional regulator n=1 Tax=Fodinibius salsisoli TaxID=2820877 RepID=A0ABT3PI11_9BACT|nr:LysR family transcriptional regulator [Fodinibius salsisoli]MCW9705551.1 LysR family transcriptional regulator [Fodinibius salsisoli]